MKGFIRIAVTMAVSAGLGLALTMLAFFNGVAETRQGQVVRHMQAMVDRVLVPAQARATLGFPVEFDSGYRELIDGLGHAAQQVGGSLSIADAAGHVVFSTDPSLLGSEVPERWRTNLSAAAADRVRNTADETIVAAPILNGFSAPVGTIIARSPRKTLLLDSFSTLSLPGAVSLGFLVLASLVAMLGVALAVRPLGLLFQDLATRYKTMAAVARAQSGDLPEGTTPGMTAVQATLAILKSIEEAGRAADAVSETRLSPKTTTEAGR